jgi:hypothetical protein
VGRIYRCTWCGSALTLGSDIVVLLATHEGSSTLMGFNTEPGNYELYLPEDVEIKPGTLWEFNCPVCRAKLHNAQHANLAELALDEGEQRKRLLFSRVAGEHATYVITESDQAVSHGEHKETYDDTVRIKLGGS